MSLDLTRMVSIGFYFATFFTYLDLGGFDYDTFKVAEFEFYLLEELEFYLIVYHPYRDLNLIAKELKLEESNLQTACMASKKGQHHPHHHHTPNIEGHGINNRNMVQWFADLNVEIEEIIEITQEILSLYGIWKDYSEESVPAMIQALMKPSAPPVSAQQQ
ncbi:hypothetical protein BG011_006343 [Mortierella polycephala]|uniref:Uncharacterized protein n=1 Tax=Mortierella polycephala TaxID=41804 RepID=A0A9P6PTV7_9FUNG|nr:hypothetical protein BG011_006343 [Mortierella polycephala]